MGCGGSTEYTEAQKSHGAFQAFNGRGLTSLSLAGQFTLPSFCDVSKRHPSAQAWVLPRAVCGLCSFDLTISPSGEISGTSTGPDFGATVGGWPHNAPKLRPKRPLLKGKLQWSAEPGAKGAIRLALYGENVDAAGINKGNWVELEIRGELEQVGESASEVAMRGEVFVTTNIADYVVDRGSVELSTK
eukprot:TRINITY_DN91462_c0_g1_i1.p1 TRINITY_DN91462_c0_g1~~TRINITY_DN91462_c0_g1_i1.p1  ORF type:complete len:188 (+),score=18.85 TRINITY_DN91462_c0_g1_i1:88-651(+)